MHYIVFFIFLKRYLVEQEEPNYNLQTLEQPLWHSLGEVKGSCSGEGYNNTIKDHWVNPCAIEKEFATLGTQLKWQCIAYADILKEATSMLSQNQRH